MKVGPNSKAAYSQATTEAGQPVASPAPGAAPNAPAAAAATAQPTPALKQSPMNKRYGGERKAELEQIVARRSRLRVTVDELAGPDTNATSETDVADDGTIALPKLDQRVRVEGLTRSQAQTAIADAYRAAKVVDEPNVTVEPAPAVVLAKLVPSDSDRGGRNAPPARTTQPAGQSALAASAAASTQQVQETEGPQAEPTSGPTIADEPLDVVILVQRNTIASTEPGGAATADGAAQNAAQPNEAAAHETPPPAAPSQPASPNAAAAPPEPANPAPPAASPPAPAPPPGAPPELPAK
jgi:hypothetical protein